MGTSTHQTSLARRVIGARWWVPLLWGIAAVLLGVLLIVQPGLTAVVLVTYVAIFWLIGGVIDLAGGLAHAGAGRAWRIVGGLVGALAGLFVVAHPLFGTLIAVATLYYVLAIGALVHGVMNLIGSQQGRVAAGATGSRHQHHILLGVVQVLLGLFLLLHPLNILVVGALIWIAGLVAIIGGVGSIVLALRLRRLPT